MENKDLQILFKSFFKNVSVIHEREMSALKVDVQVYLGIDIFFLPRWHHVVKIWLIVKSGFLRKSLSTLMASVGRVPYKKKKKQKVCLPQNK